MKRSRERERENLSYVFEVDIKYFDKICLFWHLIKYFIHREHSWFIKFVSFNVPFFNNIHRQLNEQIC